MPVLNIIVVFCGEKIIMIVDSYDLTRAITTSGSDIIVNFHPSPKGGALVIDGAMITHGIVFLAALIMAVPDLHHRLRLKILILGIIILFPFQVLTLIVYVFHFYSMNIRLGGKPVYSDFFFYGLFYSREVMVRLSGILFPVVIWAGLFFYYKWHYQFKRSKAK